MLMSIVALISFILYMVLFAIETDIILDEKSKFKREFTTNKLELNQLELLSILKDSCMIIVVLHVFIGFLYPIMKALLPLEN